MRKLIVLVAVLAASLSALAQSAPKCAIPDVNVAINRIAEGFMHRYNSGDAAQVAALYSSDAYYMTQHYAAGILHGRGQIQAYVQRGVDAKYKIDSIQVLATGCNGDMAWAITRYDSTNGGQKVFGHNLVVLKRVGGKWLIVAHESAVPEPSAIQSLEPTPKR